MRTRLLCWPTARRRSRAGFRVTTVALGEIRRGPAGAGIGAAIHRVHRHSHSPGLRHDRGFAGHAYGLSDAGIYRRIPSAHPLRKRIAAWSTRKDNDVAQGEIGELVMRGPQFMLGYWKSPDATDAVLRDGWYWRGDIVRVDEKGLYYVVDRRKEMMKYKGFSIAPAEVESVLLEHPRCAIVAWCRGPTQREKRYRARSSSCVKAKLSNQRMSENLQEFVAERLTRYKMPREIYFVQLSREPHRERFCAASCASSFSGLP